MQGPRQMKVNMCTVSQMRERIPIRFTSNDVAVPAHAAD